MSCNESKFCRINVDFKELKLNNANFLLMTRAEPKLPKCPSRYKVEALFFVKKFNALLRFRAHDLLRFIAEKLLLFSLCDYFNHNVKQCSLYSVIISLTTVG